MDKPDIDDVLLNAYRDGIFPMAESADDDDFGFYRPHMRGILPFKNLHIPKKLLKILRQKNYKITTNMAFDKIIDGCAQSTPTRSKTWINKPIRTMFLSLHHAGHAHSIEVWDTKNNLMGGLYGLSIGAVFCGESMVSFKTNGSKIALVYLCAGLKECGYDILDTQFINDHLLQFGAYEIPQEEYESAIKVSMGKSVKDLSKMEFGFDVLETFLKG